jgi:branched-subunit amino acid aminotransferase/4-amino-4-deoxychorismate lyase
MMDVWLANLQSLPTSTKIQVELCGWPRLHATTKDSQWVRDREATCQMKHSESKEILLHDPQTGDIYEGGSSNFFAIRGWDQAVMTAPLDMVLPGTMQQCLLECCRANDVAVIYQCPNVKELLAGELDACFITSTSRPVIDINRVCIGDEQWITLKGSPLVVQLQEWVAQRMFHLSESVVISQNTVDPAK